ncbi:hypothetical protein HELRODRAFT_67352 [Helobdella robusta]|uniref:Dynein heavy chain hydrolytic ATP-binding dynein motor region domain-containing protein n=1 Tax=Helobdella robusta TaxID=6412 RepID=T1FZ01_HELRO|nr:hypothetical protein HELRODRAFT_67352 [Helobdella robusta]ESN99369.1 hypothetical protein HELRODRAFT_67352 [Helobdella robusta]
MKQTNTIFQYAWEYIGNSGRLICTPLTDRVFITLTSALHIHKGGSVRGISGTGKTETIRDLGKVLGVYIVVINCSKNLDYKSLGRLFSGISQSGAWGCFDEFNRIDIEVLSVVAQQILSIITALSIGSQKFVFEGNEIKLNISCGIFTTFNLRNEGCLELPDNLKSMLRPISMSSPDTGIIAEARLFVEGFSNTKILGKKIVTLYALSQQQLSKLKHYEFGLRALNSFIKYAGDKRRNNAIMPEEEIIVLSLIEMNLAKLAVADISLFKGLVSDLFPGVETPTTENNKFTYIVENQMQLLNLQITRHLAKKVMQIHETKISCHCLMLVGNTLSGKSTCTKVLQATYNSLAKDIESGFQLAKDYPINPKAYTISELYGEFNLITGKWTDGIIPNILRVVCADEKLDEKWIIFDSCIDPLWTESMNSLMDDNRLLTLINGERISLSEQVSLIFEVEELSNTSPSTISRCSVVYFEYDEIKWQPYVKSWLSSKSDKTVTEELKSLFDKYIQKVLHFKEMNFCKEPVEISELNGIISLCNLFDSLSIQVNLSDQENLSRLVELMFLFSLIWSLCAAVDEDGRKKLDSFLREMDGTFPNKDTVFEYCLDVKNRSWIHWEDKLKTGWKLNLKLPFHHIIVPTVDTIRYAYLIESLISINHPVLLVGPAGTGKSSIIKDVINRLDFNIYSHLIVNLSANTLSKSVQNIIKSRMEKRTKGVFAPCLNKKLIAFIDDFNMPLHDEYGSQPPLELIKFWMSYGFWFDLKTQAEENIKDLLLLSAMGLPGGGRPSISSRLQSKFNLIFFTTPQVC